MDIYLGYIILAVEPFCERRDQKVAATGASQSGSLRSSWQFKLACVWGGELVSVLTSSILQMGFIWTLRHFGWIAHPCDDVAEPSGR